MKRGLSGLNMLVGIDKPVGMSSHDVVARVRRAVGERRVGHAGTLDPLASGVMVVGIGQATRLMAFASADFKSYRARFVFGCETTTDDSEGKPTLSVPAPEGALDAAWARERLPLLLAMREQVPPAFSAVQVGGVRAYAAARAGKPVDLAPRPVEVRSAQLAGVGAGPDGTVWWDLDLCVSKGTYIRSLARDLGRALESSCHVGALRRTASGNVALRDCLALEELERAGRDALRPLDPAVVLGCACVFLSEEDVVGVRSGKRLSVARTDGGAARRFAEGGRLCLVRGGALYAVAARQGGAIVPQTVFPDGIEGIRDGGGPQR